MLEVVREVWTRAVVEAVTVVGDSRRVVMRWEEVVLVDIGLVFEESTVMVTSGGVLE